MNWKERNIMVEKSDSFFINLQYAALLHDIGKIWQRTKYSKSDYRHPKNLDLSTDNIGFNGAHAKWSAEFFDKYLKLDADIRDAALFHHKPENAPTEASKKIALLVQIADWLSSSERKEKEIEDITDPVNEPLISIFSNITKIKKNGEWKDQKPYYYPIKNLNFKIGDEAVLMPTPIKKSIMSGSNLTPDYTYLWEAFERELEHIIKKGLTIELLLQLLEKYSWSVPQAAYKHLPDISLYDHLKTTCAIASCLYHANLSFEELLELKNKIYNREKTKESLFLLVKGDVSGIHNFIFTIISKSALKTLKGRSLFIEFLTEAVARTILRELNLPITNILYCGGGNFYLLLSAKSELQLKELRKKISKKVLNNLGGELYFAIDWVKLAISDFFPENFGTKWDEASEKVNSKKQTQYSEINLKENYEQFFEPFEKGGTKKQCDICHAEIDVKEIKKWEDNEVCQLCDSFSKMVDSLRTAKEVFISSGDFTDKKKSEKINSYFEILNKLGTEISFDPSEQNNNQIAYEIPNKGLPKIPFKMISRGIPFDMQEQKIRDFDTLAASATGAEMLAILKMDIDSLGKIFRFGLRENNTISRISTLSNMISRFFSGYLEELIASNEDYNNNCYTIFAGGDDLLIVGSWNIIFDLAYNIYDDFRKFTCSNPNITLSAGIIVINEKYPIIRGTSETEEALDIAKNYQEDKNNVNLFGESFKWDIFKKKRVEKIIEQFKESNYLESLNEYSIIWYIKELLIDMLNKGCPRSILQKVANSAKGLEGIIRNSLNGLVEIPKVWRLRYYLRDYFDDKSQFKAHADCIVKIYEAIVEKNLLSNNSANKISNVNCILVATRWAELLTRK